MTVGRSGTKVAIGSKNWREWVIEWVFPALFVLILSGCLAHLGYCAWQGASFPTVGFHYAISAFAS